nr:8593_t:CDS:2 [Entrophospora candida]CAG8450536.1 10523_t:CDS:2 [Entrophospora candida]
MIWYTLIVVVAATVAVVFDDVALTIGFAVIVAAAAAAAAVEVEVESLNLGYKNINGLRRHETQNKEYGYRINFN